ncbi:type VII secretion target [Actinoplanes sp. NPDC026619]|uniref:type VII secretion target n=1 Tax=Actinoplanes sp. NPDC026619 TaxID=3155798 RepID=UPI0033F6D11E
MSDAFQVDSSQLFRHAANVRAIRDQLATIKGASSAISQDDSAYGQLCGWISAILERRHDGQDQLYTYVEENLQLLADALDATGRDYDAVDSNAQNVIRAAGGLD